MRMLFPFGRALLYWSSSRSMSSSCSAMPPGRLRLRTMRTRASPSRATALMMTRSMWGRVILPPMSAVFVHFHQAISTALFATLSRPPFCICARTWSVGPSEPTMCVAVSARNRRAYSWSLQSFRARARRIARPASVSLLTLPLHVWRLSVSRETAAPAKPPPFWRTRTRGAFGAGFGARLNQLSGFNSMRAVPYSRTCRSSGDLRPRRMRSAATSLASSRSQNDRSLSISPIVSNSTSRPAME